jgi:propanediol utilization protein
MIRREIPRDVHDFDKLPVIPITVSADHVHLTKEAVDQLFGKGYPLTILNLLPVGTIPHQRTHCCQMANPYESG